MSPSRDPFGFSTKTPPQGQQRSDPIIVVAQPGQELRIVIADDDGAGAGFQNSGDSRASQSRDNRASQSGSGDNRASQSGSGDSRASQSRDAGSQDPFGFKALRRGFSPTPLTVIAHSGQEIRIVVPDQTGSFQGLTRGFSGDSRASQGGSGDG